MTDAASPASRSTGRRSVDERVSVPRMIFAAVSWVLLALVALLAIAVVIVPLVTGSKPYTVLTGSMAPQYPPGTLVIVTPVDISEIDLGDVVTYQLESGKPAVVTHRVAAVGAAADGEPLLITRGDANDADDPDPVRPVQVVGRLWYAVPYVGWINNVVTGEARAWALPIVVGLLFAYGIATIVVGARDRRRAKAALARGTRRDFASAEPERTHAAG
ncbi:signal peptidase I [Microbacterium sulfonylureivorans]|uniref:signal peptidase I n=1 Tax=Microbacterium sulfonylureivorans TaxID=2486854 RepID=UPI0013DF91C6|nr:signal peptidase I [Microbacterium sulfonylureivorans]